MNDLCNADILKRIRAHCRAGR